MFVQSTTSNATPGPILIEGIKGPQLATRLSELAADNAFVVMLIGLMETTTPDEHADAIAEQYAAEGHLHDDWYKPTASLLAFIQHAAQGPIKELLGRTHPGGLSEAPVDINTIAKMLGVSVVTVRRMVHSGSIPHLRWGRSLRFVPTDVIASLQTSRR